MTHDGTRTPRPRSIRRLERPREELPVHELALLEWLVFLHYATTRQLERLHFQPLAASSLAASRNTRRCLRQLAARRLITELDRRIGGARAGSAAYVWRATHAGHRLVHSTTYRRSAEPSLAHLDHVLDVTELVTRIHEHSRRPGCGVDILELQTEPTCWRPDTGPDGQRRWLKPDLKVTLGLAETELHWFVELDRSTERPSVLVRKAERYVTAWREGRQQATDGVFPKVLWVVPDQHRADALASAIATVRAAPPQLFDVTTMTTAIEALTERSTT